MEDGKGSGLVNNSTIYLMSDAIKFHPKSEPFF